MLRVTAAVRDGEDAEPLLAPTIDAIRREAGEYLYGIDVDNLETALVRALREKHRTAAAAESCTGGLVAKRITDISGASAVFHCGVVAYSNEIKEKVLGVSARTLAEHTAVSAETAAEMAAGIRRLSGADIGIATTGNAGPEPSEGKPVGLVYIAVDSESYREVLELNINRRDENIRALVRELAAGNALRLALKAAQASE